MKRKNKQKKILLSSLNYDIDYNYECINFALNRLYAYDLNEAITFLDQIIFHGNLSDTSMAMDYANRSENYIDFKEDWELYPYIDNKAFQKEHEEQGYANFRDFIDYESLGRDMFQKDFFYHSFYRFKDNVFEITVDSKGEHIDEKFVKSCYLSVKKLIYYGYDISTAVKIVAKGVLLGDVA